MPVTSVSKDLDALTMTVVADFPVPAQRLWDAYADPRQLELFWGTPTYPAKFTRHDMSVGGRSEYVMTGPDGEKFRGYWEVLAVDAPGRLEYLDGFANDDGSNNDDMPSMRVVMTIEEHGDGCRLTSITHFVSMEALEQVLEMGAEEGTLLAMGQIDAVVAGLREMTRGFGTMLEELTDNQVRIRRWFDVPRDTLWHAYTTPELVQQWLLGPDGWTMPLCEIDMAVGGTCRFGWDDGKGGAFGFDSVTRSIEAPYRWVTDEHMTGTDFPPTTNDLTLVEADGGTLLTLIITYADKEQRDAVLATGMTDGMETSYARLEREVLAAGD